MSRFPTLDGFGPTRRTLQLYARALNVVAREHAVSRPHWWHTSLKVTPGGLVTDNIPLPGGGLLAMRLDLLSHELVCWASDGWQWARPLDAGLSGTEMGEQLLAAVAEKGLRADYQRERFANEAPGVYDRNVVDRFFSALLDATVAFDRHRATLGTSVSPIQLWPHGFDLSTEWYGTRTERYEENGQTSELPAQLNLGFYPGEDDESTYFYSNPWPFEGDALLGKPLPAGAHWHTDGWQGTKLPYAAVRASADGEALLLEFARTVFAAAAPTLTA